MMDIKEARWLLWSEVVLSNKYDDYNYFTMLEVASTIRKKLKIDLRKVVEEGFLDHYLCKLLNLYDN